MSIAFIDLVGIKETSFADGEEYYDKLIEFHKILYNYQHVLRKNRNGRDVKKSEVCVFSDCAFIDSSSLDRLVAYLKAVRSNCFSLKSPLFFKAALVDGDLKSTEVNSYIKTAIKGSKFSPVNDSVIKGKFFSKDAVTAYLEHERSKAIGIRLGANISKNDNLEKQVNLHFPDANSYTPKPFYDIPLYSEDISNDTLENILESFYKSYVKSKKYGRYYVSLLLNWVESSDITQLDDKKSNDDYDVRRNKDIYEKVSQGFFQDNFKDYQPISYLYFATLKKIYSKWGFNKSKDYRSYDMPLKALSLLESILDISKLPKYLSTVPNEFLTYNQKEIYIQNLFEYHKFKVQDKEQNMLKKRKKKTTTP